MRNASQLLSRLSLVWLMLATVSAAHGDDSRKEYRRLVTEFCVDCHQADNAEAGINLEALLANNDFASDFHRWRRVVQQLDQKLMPPESSDRKPTEVQRRQLLSLIQKKIATAEQQHDGTPGNVVMRRLTSAEYGYAIRDLTGIEFDVERNFVSDAVGGAGFTNTGIVQFTQDSTLERYLEAARQVADHAVVGTGPLQFFQDPGQTGFELSAINRILTIYRQHGFRTSAGEGGQPFGIEKYPLAFLTAWQFRYRHQLGHPDGTMKSLADDAGIDERFAEYIYQTLTTDSPSFPTSEITKAWHRLPVPVAGKSSNLQSVTEACQRLADLLHSWQNRFGVNPDAKEEAPILRADRFSVQQSQPFEMNINWPEGTSAAHLVISVESANGDGSPNAAIVWKNPQIQFRDYAKPLAAPKPLRDFLTEETIAQLKFGGPWFGGALQPTEFGTVGTEPLAFELPIPDGARSGRLLVTAELDVKHGEDCIVRCAIAQLEETDQGKSVSGLLANPNSPAFPAWKNGVLEFARMLPQMSQREPAPSDRDPVPPPIDETYNNAERNFFHTRIKYFRDDEFLTTNILNDETRRQLDQAWADLTGSFDFHDTWLQFLARKYGKELNGRRIENLDADLIATFPAEGRNYVKSLKADFDTSQSMFAAAEAGHVNDVIHFASKAWRRPLSESERISLQEFYQSLRSESKLDHRSAVSAVLARVLVSPKFLYRSERAPLEQNIATNVAVPLTQNELASRLSFLIWSSVPDEELRRAAAAGELSMPAQLTGQVRRMVQDRKSRRFATEFFGQWFGFYRFHQFRGVDEEQFSEFSKSLQQSMYDEAIEFFDFIVRQNRPLDEILFADYAFVNQELARHYGLTVELKDSNELRRVSAAGAFHRGGLLRLGAVLATTSAPRRTSPVKRGDWILRRVLGANVPPPPADAGSIAADEVAGDGLSIRQRLIAHRSDASCHNCHARFDAFGFALENYDPIGRWRTHYRDDKPVETSGSLRDGRTISGVGELHQYLRSELPRFHETLAVRLLGYALGRQETVGDRALIVQLKQQMQDGGGMAPLMERIVSSRQFRYRQTSVDSASLRTSSEPDNE
ncbi:MAG: DUF1592 domain-containing protein [Rhodopirellula sp.]|nr:DUF1592 domain-containing protein [Rhodopirellula sp.]